MIYYPDADSIARAEAMIRALEASEEAVQARLCMKDTLMRNNLNGENIVAMARMLKQINAKSMSADWRQIATLFMIRSLQQVNLIMLSASVITDE